MRIITLEIVHQHISEKCSLSNEQSCLMTCRFPEILSELKIYTNCDIFEKSTLFQNCGLDDLMPPLRFDVLMSMQAPSPDAQHMHAWNPDDR